MGKGRASSFRWDGGGFEAVDSTADAVLSSSMHYGSAIIDGLISLGRGKGNDAALIFRLDEHAERFLSSLSFLGFAGLPGKEALSSALSAIASEGKAGGMYMRLLGISGQPFTKMAAAGQCSIYAFITPINRLAYLLSLQAPLRLRLAADLDVSVSRRFAGIKFSGRYLQPMLYCGEAAREGYDDCLFIDRKGYVTETSKSNVFFARGRSVFTPKPGYIIEGITRKYVLSQLSDMGYEVAERDIPIGDLRSFDEAFITGTYAGIRPVGSVNDVFYRRRALSSALRKRYLRELGA